MEAEQNKTSRESLVSSNLSGTSSVLNRMVFSPINSGSDFSDSRESIISSVLTATTSMLNELTFTPVDTDDESGEDDEYVERNQANNVSN